MMPRGNIANFGKKRAHAFGSPEREASVSKAKSSNKKLHGKAQVEKPERDFSDTHVRNSQGDWDRREKRVGVNRAPQMHQRQPTVHRAGAVGKSGFGLTHGSVHYMKGGGISHK